MKQLVKVIEDTCSVRKLTIDGIECDSYSTDYQPGPRGGEVTLKVGFKSLPVSFDFDKAYMALITCKGYHLYSDATWESRTYTIKAYRLTLTSISRFCNGHVHTSQGVGT